MTRQENSALNTIDFVKKNKSKFEILFRLHSRKEQSKCILQLGCTDAVSALQASEVFVKDVAAIDINMGCPKHYSVSQGMGSALQGRPEVAEDILKTLRRNLTIPVSVKTRLVGVGNTGVDLPASVEWLRRLQASGACAIALHAR